MEANKLCSKCQQLLPLTNFYVDKRKSQGIYPNCKSCHNKLTNAWAKRNRAKRKSYSRKMNDDRLAFRAILIKEAGGKCVVCGYNKYPCSLDFHHLDPSNKIDGISMMIRSYKTFLLARDETKKCKLVCKNCHSAIHSGFITLNPMDPSIIS